MEDNTKKFKKESGLRVKAINYLYGTKLTFGVLLIQHHIVYMGDHSHPNSESVIRANHEILASVTGRHATHFEIKSIELFIVISVLLILIYLKKE